MPTKRVRTAPGTHAGSRQLTRSGQVYFLAHGGKVQGTTGCQRPRLDN